MLSATQQVMFVDSMVVDSANFLRAIVTNTEEGSVHTYNSFFASADHPEGFVYVNELRNKCIFSMADTSKHTRLYTSDLLGDEWSKPEPLEGLDIEGLYNHNHPFLLPDGQTLYFSAQSSEAVGQRDIYRTRYDAEGGRFLKPENVGLPFNSEKNDYMFVVNEQDSIGFFATNRRQPAGKVCVYSFVTTESRHIYDENTIGQQRLLSLARIDRIADTWGKSGALKQARTRLAQLRSQRAQLHRDVSLQKDFEIIIDDRRCYTRMGDFRNPDNIDRMRELLSMQQQAKTAEKTLKQARARYEAATPQQRENMRSEIIQSEQQLEALHMQIRQTEKDIRNFEINN